MTTLGFIGTGAITAAMVRGLKASPLQDWPVLLSPRNAETAAGLAKAFGGVTVAASNQAVVDGADLLVLAVRPQVAEAVLRDLRLRPGQKAISLIAGLDHDRIRDWTGAASVCRAIPMPFVAERRDVTPVYPPDPDALAVFDALGRALPVADRRDFDTLGAVSALMGTYFGFAEIATDWATAQGLPAADSAGYVTQLFENLGRVLHRRTTELHDLRAEHSTRGGLNEQVFADFRDQGGPKILTRALDRVLDRIRMG